MDGCWSKSYRVEENRTKNWTFETAANSREQVPRKVLENARGKEISLLKKQKEPSKRQKAKEHSTIKVKVKQSFPKGLTRKIKRWKKIMDYEVSEQRVIVSTRRKPLEILKVWFQ